MAGLIAGDCIRHTPVDPVGGEDAKGKHELVEAADLATDLLGDHLTAEHWNYDAATAESDARDDAANVEDRKIVTVDGLEDATDEKDDGANENRPATSITVSDGPDGETCDESAQLLQTDGKGVDASLILFAIAEIGFERLESENAADDAGIVANCERRSAAF